MEFQITSTVIEKLSNNTHVGNGIFKEFSIEKKRHKDQGGTTSCEISFFFSMLDSPLVATNESWKLLFQQFEAACKLLKEEFDSETLQNESVNKK